MGGKDQDGQRTDTIESYNCLENTWKKCDNLILKKPRSGFAAVSIKYLNKVYLIGGNDGRV